MVGSLKTRDEDIVYSYIEIYSSESVYGLTTHKEYKGTTAGYKGTFSYDKLIEFLIRSIILLTFFKESAIL